MSKERNFTPGPWLSQGVCYEGEERGSCGIIGDNLGGLVGAALPWPTELDEGDFPRVDANARLMAAAPDMLSALVDAEYALAALAETFEYDEDDDAEMACAFEMLCGETVCHECGCIRDKRDACRAAIAKAVQP